jgi:hypothetical protein
MIGVIEREGLANSLRIAVLAACANGSVEFRHIQRAVDVLRPMLTPPPFKGEKTDALPIVLSLVEAGKLERVQWARDGEERAEQSRDSARYMIKRKDKPEPVRRKSDGRKVGTKTIISCEQAKDIELHTAEMVRIGAVVADEGDKP